MEDNNEVSQDIKIIENKTIETKRGRGRPRKNFKVKETKVKVKKNVEVKEKKPLGRPKKYDHRYSQKRVTYEEYDRLKKIEQKYLKIIEDLVI